MKSKNLQTISKFKKGLLDQNHINTPFNENLIDINILIDLNFLVKSERKVLENNYRRDGLRRSRLMIPCHN